MYLYTKRKRDRERGRKEGRKEGGREGGREEGRKMGKRLEQAFHKRDYLVYKHMKACLPSLVILEMQIKTTLRQLLQEFKRLTLPSVHKNKGLLEFTARM